MDTTTVSGEFDCGSVEIIGAMDSGEPGRELLLGNCRACHSTLGIEVAA